MGVNGYGIHVTSLAQSEVCEIGENGMSSGGKLFPAPGTLWPTKVHTNSDGLRVYIERGATTLTTSILVWGADRDKVVGVSDKLIRLRDKIANNTEALSKEFESWAGKATIYGMV